MNLCLVQATEYYDERIILGSAGSKTNLYPYIVERFCFDFLPLIFPRPSVNTATALNT